MQRVGHVAEAGESLFVRRQRRRQRLQQHPVNTRPQIARPAAAVAALIGSMGDRRRRSAAVFLIEAVATAVTATSVELVGGLVEKFVHTCVYLFVSIYRFI